MTIAHRLSFSLRGVLCGCYCFCFALTLLVLEDVLPTTNGYTACTGQAVMITAPRLSEGRL